jgi:GTPase SAR1 family protein
MLLRPLDPDVHSASEALAVASYEASLRGARARPPYALKIVISGAAGEGKSCLFKQMLRMGLLVNGRPENAADPAIISRTEPTIGVNFDTLTYWHADREFRIQFWDTAGMERFASITTQYLRQASWIVAAVSLDRLAEDLCDLSTRSMLSARLGVDADVVTLRQIWDSSVSVGVKKLLSIARQHVSESNYGLGFCLCVTKLDVLADPSASEMRKEALLLARAALAELCAGQHCTIHETSALSGAGVAEFTTHVVTTVARLKVDRLRLAEATGAAQAGTAQDRAVVVLQPPGTAPGAWSPCGC